MSWPTREHLLAEFRPLFSKPELADASLDKYIRGARILDDHRARTWIEQDLVRDQTVAALANDPENYTIGPSRFDLNGCYHCYGRGYVRLDVEPSHPEFGKAKLCPACRGAYGSQAPHCSKCATFSATMTEPENICWHCGRLNTAAAGDSCTHPTWHIPTANYPPPRVARRNYAAALAQQWTTR